MIERDHNHGTLFFLIESESPFERELWGNSLWESRESCHEVGNKPLPAPHLQAQAQRLPQLSVRGRLTRTTLSGTWTQMKSLAPQRQDVQI
jgi:hypothetical protein